MSFIDKFALRFTALILAIVILGYAFHLTTETGVDATNHNTLEKHHADDRPR
jgi:hypothetical protein